MTTSTFGYESYQIKYLADTPLEDVDEAWFPSVEVQLFMRRKELKEEVLAKLRKDTREARTTTSPFSDEELEHATKNAVIEMWQAGLEKYFKRMMVPKCKGYRGLGYSPDPTGA